MDRRPQEVLVVGAGIIGSAIAVHLAQRGARVTVLEAQEPGQGATHVSFAWINAHGKVPRHYHDLNRRSLDMWSRFARHMGAESAIRWGGEMRWATTEAGAAELTQRVRTMQSWGYPIRLVGPEEVRRLEPELVAHGLRVASYTGIEGHVHTAQVVTACLARAESLGAVIHRNRRITEVQRAGDVVTGVTTQAGEMSCDVLVLAGGPDMPALGRLAGVDIPIYHTRGITVVTAPVPHFLHTVALVHTPRDHLPHVNFRQFPDGAVMVQGSGERHYDQGDRGESHREVEEILARAAHFAPALAGATGAQVRRGRRPIPQDGQPILGFVTAPPNLYIAATHSGVTLAPLIGETAAIEIVDSATVDLLQPYRPQRFGL